MKTKITVLIIIIASLFGAQVISLAPANSKVFAVDAKPLNAEGKCDDGYIQLGVAIGPSGEKCVPEDDDAANPIFIYLRYIIRFLTGAVGIGIVISIIISGIRYTTSAGNPQAIEAAKKQLLVSVLGILIFIFMFAILNYLIPGGVIG